MSRSKHTEAAIIAALKQVEAGRKVEDVAARDYDESLLRDEGVPPLHLLRPFPAASMQARPVSRDVGNVRNNHPELLSSK